MTMQYKYVMFLGTFYTVADRNGVQQSMITQL